MSLGMIEMTRCTKQVLRMDEWHVNQLYLALLEGEACHIWGCINTYLRSQVCSTHSLASWSSMPTLSMKISPFCWWSLMKWWQTSICFVLECWTKLLVSFTSLLLSHSNGTCLNLILKSLKVAFIQSNWAQQLPVEMYSALMIESATLFCFFDDQDISDLFNSWHVHDVLFLSSLHPA